MAETVIAICLSILVVALVASLFFWLGARYCATKMLPGIMAGMTEKELDDLADAVDAHRQADGAPEEDGA